MLTFSNEIPKVLENILGLLCVIGIVTVVTGIWMFVTVASVSYDDLIVKTNEIIQKYFGYPDYEIDFYLLEEADIQAMAQKTLLALADEVVKANARLLAVIENPETVVKFVGKDLCDQLMLQIHKCHKSYKALKKAIKDFKMLGFVDEVVTIDDYFSSASQKVLVISQ